MCLTGGIDDVTSNVMEAFFARTDSRPAGQRIAAGRKSRSNGPSEKVAGSSLQCRPNIGGGWRHSSNKLPIPGHPFLSYSVELLAASARYCLSNA